MRWSAADILDILDEGAETYDFPMLDNNYFYLGRERLAVFRNRTEWLIAFQGLAFSLKGGGFVNSTAAFGNALEENGIVRIEDVALESPDSAFFDAENRFRLDPLDFKLIIKGTEREFTPSEDAYRMLGIDVRDAGMPKQAKIIRYLSHAIPDELFFRHEEILSICGRTGSGLKVLVELDDWQHPDLLNDEMPSQTTCFRSLAVAIEKNDIGLLDCPKDRCNAHWSNWEWYRYVD
ncbi:MAG: hypothetical protein JXR96_09995 [Deltaproteobacteria bacterium]|nr:hypothetical protein [Deltaproteobacteria bacterium]